VARPLLIRSLVLVETVFQYRTLIGKSESGCGLDWDEIRAVCDLEHELGRDAGESGRRYKRVPVALQCILRGDRINDRVAVVELGPGDLICRGAPFVAQGELVELVIDVGEQSYRFRAVGTRLVDDGDDYEVGLQFVGVPLCLNIAQVSAHEFDLVDQINAAA
jgi:hypothetical protein